MVKKINVFSIIVTYNGMRWYDKCLSSLLQSTIETKIIVVDNNSSDGSINYIREKYPSVTILSQYDNLGFGRANNIGIRYALDNNCDYVFLLNQDAWVKSDTLETLISIAEANTNYGIISPIHLAVGEDSINMCLDDGNKNMNLLSDLMCGRYREIYSVQYVNAAAWLVTRSTLETIGGFCPLIFHYGEDDDYLNRCKYHQIKIGLVPSAKIIHDTGVRLESAKMLSSKANLEELDVYLDITKGIPLSYYMGYYFRKWILSIFRLNIEKTKFFWHKYRLIIKNKKAIESAREQHMKQQSSWI